MATFAEWVGKTFRLTDHEPITTIFGGQNNHSGKEVTVHSALTLATAWSCIRLLTETLSQLPPYLVRKEKGKRFVDEDNTANLTMIKPNPWMDWISFIEALMLNLLTHGNCYAEIERNNRGDVVNMIPLLSEKMEVVFEDGIKTFRYNTAKGILIYPMETIMHIKLFGWAGLVGLSPIAYAAQSIGLALAAEEYGARFFGNGARPSGFLLYPGTLKPDQRKRLRKTFERLHEGLEKSHKLAILEADMKYQAVTIPPNEAQFLETRNFQVPQVCSWYLVQPHKVGWLDKATYTNIEHQDLEFYKTTMAPYLKRFESGLTSSFFPDLKDQMKYKCKFNLAALMKADHEARSNYYVKMVANGIYTRNEARILDDKNPSDQPGADELTVQSNMIGIDDLEKIGDQGK